MKNKLEKICTFAEECSESDYGSLEICKEDYVDCEVYKKIIKQKSRKYQNEKISKYKSKKY